MPERAELRTDWPEAFWLPVTRGLIKDSDGTITPGVEAVDVPARLHHQGPRKPSSYAPFTLNSLGQSCHRQKKSHVYARRVTSVMCNSLWPCRLWPARLVCQEGVSRQEYWSVLANTGCHTLLELYISCCPSQLPWLCGAARTPATQAAAPPPSLALRGKPKSSRAASGANPSGRSTCKGGNKTTIETQWLCG